jgi:beta-phosphoglucomutase-like phosphatase (HAD superfamily)
VKNGKPDPEPYLKGASLLGVSASDCIVVEDVPAGIRAGKAAGARVVACRTTASDLELEAAGSDWIVEGCNSISLTRSSVANRELTLVLNQDPRNA